MEDSEKRLLEQAGNLAGISYLDWVRLQHLVDRMFDAEKKKMESQLHLPLPSEKDLLLF